MKSSLCLIVSALLSVMGLVSCGNADSAQTPGKTSHRIIGVNPGLSKNSREKALEQVLGLLLKDTGPGDRLDVYDASSFQRIGSVELPANQMYSNTRVKLKAVESEIVAIKQFLMEGGDRIEGSPSMRLPQFLRFLAEQGPGNPSSPRCLQVVVVGDLLYDDPREPGFSMTDSWPSDAHLSATEDLSVFSAMNAQTGLAGADLLLADFGETEFLNELHANRCKRFWRLFAHEFGIDSVSFQADLGGGGVSPSPVREEVDPKETRLLMYRANPRAVETDHSWITDESSSSNSNVPMHGTVNPVDATESGLSPQIENIAPSPLKLGIRWSNEAEADLDVYVRDPGTGKEIYYESMPGEAGGAEFYKDYSNGGQLARNGFEAVHLPEVADPGEVEVWVNLYRAKPSVGEVKGELRMVHGGRSLSRSFVLPAASGGDRGKHRDGDRASSPCWIKINLAELLAGS